jgi:hypothetical protein
MPAISSAAIQQLIRDLETPNKALTREQLELVSTLEKEKIIPPYGGFVENLRRSIPAMQNTMQDIGARERWNEERQGERGYLEQAESDPRRELEQWREQDLERLRNQYAHERADVMRDNPFTGPQDDQDLFHQHHQARNKTMAEEEAEAARKTLPFLEGAANVARGRTAGEEAAAWRDLNRREVAERNSGAAGMEPPIKALDITGIPQPLDLPPPAAGDPNRQWTIDNLLNRQHHIAAMRPYVAYSPEARVAAVPAEQKRANLLANETGDYKPYLERARQMNAQSASSFPSQVQEYMNPYQHHVVDRIAELGKRNFAENIMPMLEAQFVKSGQFGSSRHADLAQRAARDQQAETQAAQRQALSEGYGQAAAIHNADKERMFGSAGLEGSLGQSTQEQRLRDYEALQNAGDLNRDVDQQHRDARYNEWIRKYNNPAEQAGIWNSYMRGTPLTLQQPAAPRQSFNRNTLGNLIASKGPGLAEWAATKLGVRARGGAIKEIEDRRK